MRALSPIVALILAVAVGGCGGDETTTTAPTGEGTITDSNGVEEPDERADESSGDRDQGDRGGGSGDTETVSPGAEPETALEVFFTSGDPGFVCDLLSTKRLVATAYGDERGCRQAQRPGATPESIRIKRLDVSEDTAEAVVVPSGGPNDGIETDVVLVRPEYTWRVDSLEADVPAGP